MSGDVAFDAPTGWVRAEVARPVFTSGTEITIDRWDAWRAPDDGAGRAVSACLGVDLRTWADEATPFALDRLAATAGSVASRLDPALGLQASRTERTGVVATQTFVDRDRPLGPAVARTFLGFAGAAAPPHLRACFVVCAPTTRACEVALAAARPTSEFAAPPPASAPLRALVLGVHHPRAVAAGGAALFVLSGLVAVWTRPRPRRK